MTGLNVSVFAGGGIYNRNRLYTKIRRYHVTREQYNNAIMTIRILGTKSEEERRADLGIGTIIGNKDIPKKECDRYTRPPGIVQ